MKKVVLCILALSLVACTNNQQIEKPISEPKKEVKEKKEEVISSYDDFECECVNEVDGLIESLDQNKENMCAILSRSFSSFSSQQSKLDDWYTLCEDDSLYLSILDTMIQYYRSSDPEFDKIPSLIDDVITSHSEKLTTLYDDVYQMIQAVEEQSKNIDMEEVEVSFPDVYSNHKAHLDRIEKKSLQDKEALLQFHNDVVDGWNQNDFNIEKIYKKYRKS